MHSINATKSGKTKFTNPPTKGIRRIDKIKEKGDKVSKFFIRIHTDSKSKSKNLIMSNVKLGDDYLAQLGKNVFDDRAWFYYDYSTHTVRLASNPEWVLSNQRGEGNKPGKKVVFT